MLKIEHTKVFNQALLMKLFSEIGENSIRPNRRFFEDEKNVLLVAFYGLELAGFLYAYQLDNLKYSPSKIFLYSIDVFIPYQQMGIGTARIERLKEIAKNRACREFFVLTNKNNLAAMSLYAKTGGILEGGDDVLFVYKCFKVINQVVLF